MDGVNVCVLGAGIVGLTTALFLQTKYKNVTIIAEKFTTETTSDGAAGLFCPFSSFRASTFQVTKEIVKDSYLFYENLRKTFGEKETGIMETSGYILSNVSLDEVKNPLIEDVVPDYKILSPEELKNCPGEWKYGIFFRSLIIQGRVFLPWILQRFQKNGGKVIQKKIISFEDLIPYNYDIIVNCTGLGAKYLCEDNDLIPVKGQVLKVSAPFQKHFYLLDDDVYVIPGIETTLGGTRHFGNYDLSIDKEITARIWKNCTNLLPELKSTPVIREWAGLRPHRVPLRLESETIRLRQGELKVIHNYGHGSQGVTTAPGSAKIASNLVVEVVKVPSKL